MHLQIQNGLQGYDSAREERPSPSTTGQTTKNYRKKIQEHALLRRGSEVCAHSPSLFVLHLQGQVVSTSSKLPRLQHNYAKFFVVRSHHRPLPPQACRAPGALSSTSLSSPSSPTSDSPRSQPSSHPSSTSLHYRLCPSGTTTTLAKHDQSTTLIEITTHPHQNICHPAEPPQQTKFYLNSTGFTLPL